MSLELVKGHGSFSSFGWTFLYDFPFFPSFFLPFFYSQ